MHIYVSKKAIISSDNVLSHSTHQDIMSIKFDLLLISSPLPVDAGSIFAKAKLFNWKNRNVSFTKTCMLCRLQLVKGENVGRNICDVLKYNYVGLKNIMNLYTEGHIRRKTYCSVQLLYLHRHNWKHHIMTTLMSVKNEPTFWCYVHDFKESILREYTQQLSQTLICHRISASNFVTIHVGWCHSCVSQSVLLRLEYSS